MQWIVGVDTRPSSEGAVRYAQWLAERTTPPSELIPVHVLEEPYLQVVLRYHSLDNVMQSATDTVQQVLRSAGVASEIKPLVMPGRSAEETLDKLVEDHQPDGIVIGRQAKIGKHPVVRLGRVARRLLRSLPTAVIVAPPDLDPNQLGSGPVLLASDAREDNVPAALFARNFASAHGRDLLVAHVVPMAEDFGAHYIPADTLERFREEQATEGRLALQGWMEANGMHGARSELLQGPIIESVTELARREGSPLIVCGSRRLSLVERLAQASIGTELSCTSHCPVAVVPPPPGEEG